MEQKMVGNRIRRLRERKAWTQEHLADAARISARTVQRAEEGVMSAETMTAIAGALDVAVEKISTPNELPAGWPRITPALFYDDSTAAVEWLVTVFGFEARLTVPDGQGHIVHSELTLEEGLIMVGWAGSAKEYCSPKGLAGHPQSLLVYVDDVDAHFAHAKRAGAKITSELQNAYGIRRYMAEDPEGHLWSFATSTGAK